MKTEDKLTFKDGIILVIAATLTLFAIWLLCLFITPNILFTCRTIGGFFLLTGFENEFSNWKERRRETC